MAKEAYGDFKLIESREYPDEFFTVHIYEHSVFKCKFVYVETKDNHNTFSAIFKTIPCSDMGESHMLEHLILDGSEKYPVKQVFAELSKRSYAETMNAATYPFHTDFYFSSTNEKDFMDCLSVYLDCVFHPLLTQDDFYQECHHLYFENNDPNNKLVHGGVIYNEMLGSAYTPIRLKHHTVTKNLLPDTPSRFLSGGIPSEVATANVEHIREHYAKYYHPSNALFFYYGSADPEEVFGKVLKSIENHPEKLTKIDIDSLSQEPWTEPRTIEFEGPADQGEDPDNSHTVTVAYDTHVSNDVIHKLSLGIICDYLAGMQSSPLEKAVIVSRLAKTIKAYQITNYETTVFITADGVKKEDVEKVEEIIVNTTKEALLNIDEDSLDVIMRYYKRTILSPKENLGMDVYKRVTEGAVFGGSIFENIALKESIDKLTELIKDPNYLRDIAKKFIIENKHRLIAHVIPKADFTNKLTTKAEEGLEEIKAKLTEEEKSNIIEIHKRIEEQIRAPRPTHLLPCIKKDDLNRTATYFKPTKVVKDVTYFKQPTNGMIAVRLLGKIPVDYRHADLLAILTFLLTEVGAGDRDEFEFQKFCLKYMTLSMDDRDTIVNDKEEKLLFTIRATALEEDIDYVIEAIRDRVLHSRINTPERVKIALSKIIQSIRCNAGQSTYFYAKNYAQAAVSRNGAILEMINGLWGDKKVLDFIENNSTEDIIKMVEDLYRLFQSGHYQITINGSAKAESYIDKLQALADEINNTPKFEYEHYDLVGEVVKTYSEKCPTFISLETTTGSSAVAFKAPTNKNPDYQKYMLFTGFIKNQYMSNEIREKYGAYGSFSTFSHHGGSLVFFSYRGTRVVEILNAYTTILEKIANGQVTQEQVDNSVIKKLSLVDESENPLDVGVTEFIKERSEEDVQKLRDYYFSATKEDMIGIAKELLEKKQFRVICTSPTICECPEDFTLCEF